MADTHPILSAQFINSVVAGSPDRVRHWVKIGLQNLMQDKHLPLTEKPPRLVELQALIERHDETFATAADVTQLPGVRQQAVQALVREEQLVNELFDDARG